MLAADEEAPAAWDASDARDSELKRAERLPCKIKPPQPAAAAAAAASPLPMQNARALKKKLQLFVKQRRRV
jgi:hypothetical protein